MKKIFLYAVVLIILLSASFLAADKIMKNGDDDKKPPDVNLPVSNGVKSIGYGVVADDRRAVAIGMEILSKGGSAVDAAIAVSYAMGVVLPVATGPGGSGVMLVYPGDTATPVVYDYMGTAPANRSSRTAVPGFVAGMESAHRDYGKLSWQEILDPSIKLAREGTAVSNLLAGLVRTSGFRISGSARNLFFPGGRAIVKGALLKQTALADTLEKIRDGGQDAFYKGETGKDIADNSSLSLKELAGYQTVKSIPASGYYAGYKVYVSTPPTGGITMLQTIGLSEKMNLSELSPKSSAYISLLAAITQVTYNDRLSTIADPNFYKVDQLMIASSAYMDQLVNKARSIRHFDDLQVDDATGNLEDDENTTHIVVYDETGMMVSMTNTLTQFFGTGRSAGGFFLNNHMDNFSSNPKSLNAPETGKRPRSFISPAILEKDGRAVIGIGSPGGMRIPLMVTQVLNRFIEDGQELQAAIDAPRFFYNANKLYLEKNYLSEKEKNKLRKQGVQVILYTSQQFYGSVNALYIDYDKREITGGADPRRGGGWDWMPGEQ